MKTRTRNRGITLVELMTTVSVAAVTLSLGVPAFTGVQASMLRTQASMEMIASFSLARSEAARRGVSVTVCPPNTDGTACSSDHSPNWASGWIVFTDPDEDRNIDSGTDEIVHTARLASGNISITSDSSIASGVLFSGSGFPDATGSYTYCDADESRVLALSYIGRLEQVSSGTGCL